MEQCWFRDSIVGLMCCRTSANVDMRRFVMKMSRHGKQCLFWPLALPYEVLQLSSFKKQAARWVQHELPRCSKWLAACLGDAQVGRGRQARVGDDIEDMSGDLKCLPKTSVSTWGLLMLLCRFAFASVQTGGFRERISRQAAVGRALRGVLALLCVQARRAEQPPGPGRRRVSVHASPTNAGLSRYGFHPHHRRAHQLARSRRFRGGGRANATCRRWRRALGKACNCAQVSGKQDISLLDLTSACVSVSALRPLGGPTLVLGVLAGGGLVCPAGKVQAGRRRR